MKRAFMTEDAPRPAGPYSHAVRAGDTIYLAGQGPFDPVTGEQPDEFEERVRQTFRNLEATARSAGGSLADAVRIGVYLRDMGDFGAMNKVYAEIVPEPHPVRTTIQSNLVGLDVEIDAVLWVGGRS
ncbi:MAG: endoribonuclease [Chthonomonadaceae bacterium]|nr:endoribonuclease [Chthonomonadaceae bacterium]